MFLLPSLLPFLPPEAAGLPAAARQLPFLLPPGVKGRNANAASGAASASRAYCICGTGHPRRRCTAHMRVMRTTNSKDYASPAFGDTGPLLWGGGGGLL